MNFVLKKEIKFAWFYSLKVKCKKGEITITE